jgi:hypothetical protein
MSIEYQRFFDSRGFRFAVIAFAAVVVLAVAAFLFGTGLQADTSTSVAPSPLGSSIANVREVQSVAPSPLGSSIANVREVQSVAPSPLGSSIANVREVQSVARSPLGSSLTGVRGIDSAAASRAASLAALAERWAPFYAGLDKALKDAGARP